MINDDINNNEFNEQELKILIEQIESLNKQKETINYRITDLLNKGQIQGFPKDIVKKIIQCRKKPVSEIERERFLIDKFLRAIE